jgi:hypothetical protein
MMRILRRQVKQRNDGDSETDDARQQGLRRKLPPRHRDPEFWENFAIRHFIT